MTTDNTIGGGENSRRGFLKQAALVAGLTAAAGLGTSASAQPVGQALRKSTAKAMGKGEAPRPPRPDETIRVGLIGVGGMGRGHLGGFVGLNGSQDLNMEIVAICDVNDLHIEQGVNQVTNSGQSKKPATYRDYREMFEKEDLHGVVIATPEHWHGKMAIDAVVRGIDVYCEKPMTLHLDEALAVRETVHNNPGVIFVVGTQKMMLPKYIEAKRLIEAGEIGVPTFSQTSYCRNSPDGEWNYYQLDDRWKPGKNLDWDAWLGDLGPREWDPKVYIRWRRYRDFSTGILGDLLVHEMTPMMMALDSLGWPTRVVATGAHLIDKEMENHDQVNLTVQFESGHTMIVAGSTCNEVGLENLIRGHEANLYLNSRHCDIRPTRPYVDLVDARRIQCPDIGNDQDQMRIGWIQAIRDRKQPSSTVDFATKVMVAVDLASRSIWNGKAYSYDSATSRVTEG